MPKIHTCVADDTHQTSKHLIMRLKHFFPTFVTRFKSRRRNKKNQCVARWQLVSRRRLLKIPDHNLLLKVSMWITGHDIMTLQRAGWNLPGLTACTITCEFDDVDVQGFQSIWMSWEALWNRRRSEARCYCHAADTLHGFHLHLGENILWWEKWVDVWGLPSYMSVPLIHRGQNKCVSLRVLYNLPFTIHTVM